jgi:Ca2+-binding RTX toxin-like protein
VVLDLNDPNGVTIGTGVDQRYLRGMESLYGFTTGSGNDVITLHSSGALQNVIDTGAGSDTVTVYGGATAATTDYNNINLGSSNDLLIVDFSAATQPVVYVSNGSGYAGASIGGVQHHTYSGIERVTFTSGSANDIVDARPDSTSYARIISTGSGDDQLYGSNGDDRLDGGADNDLLSGGIGNDVLIGGYGADGLTGGAGNDLFYVDQQGDSIVELDGEGYDIVIARGSYGLGAGVSAEVLMAENGNSSADPVQLLGNELSNLIYGTLGNNLIDGGAGQDIMVGYAGDDFYFVDHALEQIFEAPGEGRDTVATSIDYILAPGLSIEVLQALGSAPLTLVGNELDNLIYGNSGNNVLAGVGGIDVMVGGAGNDVFHVDNALETVYELAGEGYDIVYATVGYTLPGAAGGRGAGAVRHIADHGAKLHRQRVQQPDLRQRRQQRAQPAATASTSWSATAATTPSTAVPATTRSMARPARTR